MNSLEDQMMYPGGNPDFDMTGGHDGTIPTAPQQNYWFSHDQTRDGYDTSDRGRSFVDFNSQFQGMSQGDLESLLGQQSGLGYQAGFDEVYRNQMGPDDMGEASQDHYVDWVNRNDPRIRYRADIDADGNVSKINRDNMNLLDKHKQNTLNAMLAVTGVAGGLAAGGYFGTGAGAGGAASTSGGALYGSTGAAGSAGGATAATGAVAQPITSPAVTETALGTGATSTGGGLGTTATTGAGGAGTLSQVAGGGGDTVNDSYIDSVQRNAGQGSTLGSLASRYGGAIGGITELYGAYDQRQRNAEAADRMSANLAPYEAAAADITGRLRNSYEDPESVYRGDEWQAIQNTNLQRLQREDAARGGNANAIGRQAKLQDIAAGYMKDYRSGLSRSALGLGQIATGQAGLAAIGANLGVNSPWYETISGWDESDWSWLEDL